jgi:2-oxoglutarate ferredoxin oxidoreductase subunit alpha
LKDASDMPRPTGTPERAEHRCLIDGSRLIVESLARSGADVFVGYPITPANLLYAYGFKRLPVAIAAPDEITALQWMAGFSACGRIPVTATSFPGFAIMIESIGMAHMMELPMVVVLAQRLGPATGSATAGAQGDLLLLHGMISGGYAVPVLCPADFRDCWELPSLAVHTAVRLRSPVVLLTSRETVMTQRDFDLGRLPDLTVAERVPYSGQDRYEPYAPEENLVPAFLPVGNDRHQVRLTASTHGRRGVHESVAAEALANTARLQEKVIANLPEFTRYELDEQDGAGTIVVAWDITALAARQAVARLRARGRRVSLLVPKTLSPIPPIYTEVLARYARVVIAEENLTGQLRLILYGCAGRPGMVGVNAIGRMVSPGDIISAVEEQ